MAKFTQIEVEDGGKTITIIETTLDGESMVMGGGWNKKAEQIKREATHVLTRYQQSGDVFWAIENVVAEHQTAPLYCNLTLEEVKKKLLNFYLGNQKIVYNS